MSRAERLAYRRLRWHQFDFLLGFILGVVLVLVCVTH